MTCDRAQEMIAAGIGDGALGFTLRAHLFRCAACSEAARRQASAIRLLRRDFLPHSPDFSRQIMAAIRLAPEQLEVPVSFRNWILVGVVLLAAIGVSPLGSAFSWIKSVFGTDFLIPLNIVLGLVFASYCALFIGTHLEEIAEKLKLRNN